MKKETRYFIIYFSEDDLAYIDEICTYLENEMKKIVAFFKINEFGEKMNITLFDNAYTLWNLHDSLYKTVEKYGEVPKWVCGFSYNNNVYTLSLNELRKTKGHENSSLDNLKKLIMHESIHNIHAKKNKKTLYTLWLSEGLATTLSHQYDNIEPRFDVSLDEIINGKCYYYNYNAMFLYILNNYGQEYVLKLIENDNFLNNEISRLYEETIHYYKNNQKNN